MRIGITGFLQWVRIPSSGLWTPAEQKKTLGTLSDLFAHLEHIRLNDMSQA